MTISARDLMTTDVATAAPDEEVGDVLGRLARADFDGFPVLDDGDLVGIVTRGDILRLFRNEERVVWIPIGVPPFSETLTYAIDLPFDDLDLGIDVAKQAQRPIREAMTEEVVTVGPDTEFDRLVDLLTDDERDINRLPVLDDGALVGIVTRQDLLRALRRD
jgi:CBS domain-containing protein